MSTSDPLLINGKHATVEGGDRSGASLFKSLQIKDGDTTRIYHLFDDCLIRADSDDDSKPPYIAKIVAIGTGGPMKKVMFCFKHSVPAHTFAIGQASAMQFQGSDSRS